MPDEKPVIECRWEIDEAACRLAFVRDLAPALAFMDTGNIEAWFKKELSDALRVLIVEDGVAGISFTDDSTPEIRFWADGAQIEELTYAEPLAADLYEVIADWAGDLDDAEAGPKNRRDLMKLREVLRGALDKIDTALL